MDFEFNAIQDTLLELKQAELFKVLWNDTYKWERQPNIIVDDFITQLHNTN